MFYPSDSGSGHFLCGAPQFRVSFKSLFYCSEQPLCWWSELRVLWRQCVNVCLFGLGGVGKLLCGHVSVGIRAKLGWMTSSLWACIYSNPPPYKHPHNFCLHATHAGVKHEHVPCLPPKLRVKELQHKKQNCDIVYHAVQSCRSPLTSYSLDVTLSGSLGNSATHAKAGLSHWFIRAPWGLTALCVFMLMKPLDQGYDTQSHVSKHI